MGSPQNAAKGMTFVADVLGNSHITIIPQSDFVFAKTAYRSQLCVLGHPQRSKRMITPGRWESPRRARVVWEMGAGMWSAGRAATSRCSPGMTVSDLWHRRKSLPVLALCCVEFAGCRSGRISKPGGLRILISPKLLEWSALRSNPLRN
jgi:hypothetical protein